MQKLSLAVALALVTLPPLAAAATEFTGTILVGHPLTNSFVQSVNGRLHPCDPASPTNGLDGYWFDVGGLEGLTATLTMDPTLDVDAYWWTAGCDFIPDFGCVVGYLGTPETCAVPVDARYASVEGWLGSGAFTLAIG